MNYLFEKYWFYRKYEISRTEAKSAGTCIETHTIRYTYYRQFVYLNQVSNTHNISSSSYSPNTLIYSMFFFTLVPSSFIFFFSQRVQVYIHHKNFRSVMCVECGKTRARSIVQIITSTNTCCFQNLIAYQSIHIIQKGFYCSDLFTQHIEFA